MTKLEEAMIDIALNVGYQMREGNLRFPNDSAINRQTSGGRVVPSISRETVQCIKTWAKQFESIHKGVTWGTWDAPDYLDAIEAFTDQKLIELQHGDIRLENGLGKAGDLAPEIAPSAAPESVVRSIDGGPLHPTPEPPHPPLGVTARVSWGGPDRPSYPSSVEVIL